jgi:hypothetical protein
MVGMKAQFGGEREVSAPQKELKPQEFVYERAEIRESDSFRATAPVVLIAVVSSVFWAGAVLAYLLGYFGAQQLGRDPLLLSLAVVVTFLPPLLFIAVAFAHSRARTMSDTVRHLAAVSDRLTATDDTALQSAQRIGRAVRMQLDALSNGLDSAFGRLRALETALEDRVAQLEDASARAGVKAENIAQRLSAEREGIEELANRLDESATRAVETLAGRGAQLKTMIESVSGELKSVGQTLEAQVVQFREAAEKAANAPQQAAIELDRQAKQIETAGDTTVARAEFVLARQERQRVAMNELLTRLQDEAKVFEAVLESQRKAAERAATALSGETHKLQELTDHGLRRIDAAMANTASTLAAEAHRINELADQGLRRIDTVFTNTTAHSSQLAANFGKDVDKIKETAESAADSIASLVQNLREATTSAQALIADSAADAKRRSKDFVGEAMGSCDQLLRAANSVAENAEKARTTIVKAVEDAERHIMKLPAVAAQEAERVRETVRSETEQMLDISARTLVTLRMRGGRNAARPEDAVASPEAEQPDNSMGESLRGLARRITSSKRKTEDRPKTGGGYDLSAVLAAAEAREPAKPGSKGGAGPNSALAHLQAALADLAGDLDELSGEQPDLSMWRRYLDGDRGVFARRLAASIGPDSVNRITGLYRDNPRFHEAADTYLAEFEAMLARAREGDRDGFFASTLLMADTGKIYLTIAYALGRLE